MEGLLVGHPVATPGTHTLVNAMNPATTGAVRKTLPLFLGGAAVGILVGGIISLLLGRADLRASNVDAILAAGAVILVLVLGGVYLMRRLTRLGLREAARGEARYFRLVDQLQEGIWLIDEKGFTTFVNPAMAEMLGYSVEEMLGRHLFDFMDEEGTGEARKKLEVRKQGVSEQHEFRFLRKNEDSLHALVTTSPLLNKDGNYEGALAGVLDISKRVEMERALQESEARYRQLFNEMQEGFGLFEIIGDQSVNPEDFRVLEVNPAFERLTGLRARELAGRRVSNVLPDTGEGLLRRCGAVVRTGKAIRFESKLNSLNRTFEISAYRPQEGQFAITLSDVTDRRAAEAALRESERRFRSVFEGSPLGVGLGEPDGTLIAVNRRLCEMLGYREADFLGRDFSTFSHPEDVEPSKTLSREVASGQRSRFQLEKRYVKQDGATVWVGLTVSSILDDGGRPVYTVALMEDITERHRAQEELVASEERLRALSERLVQIREEERLFLARELHDELGQTLTGLRMDLSMLREEYPIEDSLRRGRIQELIRTVDLNVELVRDLSSRLRPPILDVMGLGPAIAWHVEEQMERIPADFHLALEEDPGDLRGDAGISAFRIMQEALTNILRHSRARNVWVSLRRGEDGRVVLQIRDDGIGIPEAEVHSRGSLGILGMRERASSLGGTLTVDSTPGNGTTVRLEFHPEGEEILEEGL